MLWSFLLLVGAGAVYGAIDRDVLKDNLDHYRVESQNLHIDKLEKDVAELEHELKELGDPVSKGQIRRAKARVRNLEGRPI